VPTCRLFFVNSARLGYALGRQAHLRLGDAHVFVYSTHDAYVDRPEDLGATRITRADLLQFMADRPELLPPRISRWLSASR
jgi:hypothetical protein